MAAGDETDADIIPPSPDETETPGAFGTVSQILLAEVKNYTDRPDLFLETMERHDPGFIRRLNRDAEKHAEKLRISTFNFGRFQAYLVLFMQLLLSLLVIAILAAAVIYNQAGAGTVISLGIVLAIIMSGPSGFSGIVRVLEKWLRRSSHDD